MNARAANAPHVTFVKQQSFLFQVVSAGVVFTAQALSTCSAARADLLLLSETNKAADSAIMGFARLEPARDAYPRMRHRQSEG